MRRRGDEELNSLAVAADRAVGPSCVYLAFRPLGVSIGRTIPIEAVEAASAAPDASVLASFLFFFFFELLRSLFRRARAPPPSFLLFPFVSSFFRPATPLHPATPRSYAQCNVRSLMTIIEILLPLNWKVMAGLGLLCVRVSHCRWKARAFLLHIFLWMRRRRKQMREN